MIVDNVNKRQQQNNIIFYSIICWNGLTGAEESVMVNNNQLSLADTAFQLKSEDEKGKISLPKQPEEKKINHP